MVVFLHLSIKDEMLSQRPWGKRNVAAIQYTPTKYLNKSELGCHSKLKIRYIAGSLETIKC